MDVYFYEAFTEEQSALARVLGPSVSCDFFPRTIQESGHADPPARLVSIRTQSTVPSSWKGHIDGILSRTTGFDHLKALRPAFPEPFPLGYLEEYATRAVAEHALLMVMALLRRLPAQQVQFGMFERDGLTGSECSGRKLLVVGVGRIGHELVHLSSAMGMVVRGVDTGARHGDVAYVEKEEGVRWADVIVCCMNLTYENRGYFSAELLRRGRKGHIFINVARGEHAPLAGLRDLLSEGQLGGLGLDVFENEPSVAGSLRAPSPGHSDATKVVRELLAFPNVLFTPHNAFNTAEAVERKAAFTTTQIDHFMRNGDFLWRV